MHYGVVDALWSKFCHNMKLILGWNNFCRPLDPSLDIWSNFVKRKNQFISLFCVFLKKMQLFLNRILSFIIFKRCNVFYLATFSFCICPSHCSDSCISNSNDLVSLTFPIPTFRMNSWWFSKQMRYPDSVYADLLYRIGELGWK